MNVLLRPLLPCPTLLLLCWLPQSCFLKAQPTFSSQSNLPQAVLEAAFNFRILAPHQLGPPWSLSLVSFLGNSLVHCTLWEDGSPALFFPTRAGTVPWSFGRVTPLCIWRRLQEALFSSLTVRGHLTLGQIHFAASIWSFLLFQGRALLGPLKERGFNYQHNPNRPRLHFAVSLSQ